MNLKIQQKIYYKGIYKDKADPAAGRSADQDPCKRERERERNHDQRHNIVSCMSLESRRF